MKRIAFKMKLNTGNEAEYMRRHDAIWEDLQSLLHDKGIRDYSIFLDRQTGDLFATLQLENPSVLDELAREPVMKKWWAFMKDLMECNPDNSPVSRPLEQIFYLP